MVDVDLLGERDPPCKRSPETHVLGSHKSNFASATLRFSDRWWSEILSLLRYGVNSRRIGAPRTQPQYLDGKTAMNATPKWPRTSLSSIFQPDVQMLSPEGTEIPPSYGHTTDNEFTDTVLRPAELDHH